MKVLIAVDDQECSTVAFEQVLDQCWSSDTHFRCVRGASADNGVSSGNRLDWHACSSRAGD